MATKDGGPAFPQKKRVHRMGYATEDFEPVGGMSLRDYFAARAEEEDIRTHMEGPMQKSVTKSPAGRCYITHETTKYTREQAKFRYADAMLKAREQ